MQVPSPSFAVNNTVICEVAKVNYLGHVIANDMTDYAHMMRQRRQLYELGNVLSSQIKIKHQNQVYLVTHIFYIYVHFITSDVTEEIL